ncbi:unnamed protein product [Trichobilharzia szidati]|nr:unnamed protein product [Trichobilharzia szidati]
MYKLDPLVEKLTHFVHTDSMYKLKNLFPHSNDSNIIKNNISCVANDTSERDQTILNELHQLDNNITFLLNIFKSYKPKKRKNCGQTSTTNTATTTVKPTNTAATTNTTPTATRTISTAETAALKKSFVDELHELSSHVNNLLNYPKADPTTANTNAQSVQALLSRLDGELNSLIDLFTSYPNQLVNRTTTTPSTSAAMMNCLLPMRIPKEPVTFIIQCNPNNPPLSVLLLCHLLITNHYRVTIKSFKHSTVMKELPQSLEKFLGLLTMNNTTATTTAAASTTTTPIDTNLNLHFIWNLSCPDCVISSFDKSITPSKLYGECMLVELIYRVFQSTQIDDKLLSLIIMIDSKLLLPSLSPSLCTSSTTVVQACRQEKALTTLNAHSYFQRITRDFPSIIDCYLYTCLKQLNLFNVLPGNLKVWLKFCQKWKSFTLLSL